MLSLNPTREKIAFQDVLRAGLPGCVIAAVCLSFFLTRAFTIDDTIFLRAARQATLTPLHPFAFDMCWESDGVVRHFSQFVANAPLMGYLLIPAVLSAFPELTGHILQILLLAAGILATASLALRLGLSRSEALLAGLLTATCPVVLGMAATVMPDILAMTLGVIALERFMAWRQDRTWWNWVAASSALTLAPLARPHLALMLPICALQSLSYVSWTHLKKELPRLVPGILLIGTSGAAYLAIATLTRDPAARAVVLRAGLVRLSPGLVLAHGYSFGCYLALTTPFVAVVLLFVLRQTAWRKAAIVLLVPLLIFALAGKEGGILFGVAAIASLALAWSLAQLWRVRTGAALALALWALLPLAMVVYLHMAAKYLVPSVPAYSLFLAALSRNSAPLSRWMWRALPVAGVAFGMLIVMADTRAANMARFAIEKWLPPLEGHAHRILFQGQWGFQWYAESHGAACFNPVASGSAEPGDFVIVDRIGSRPFPRKLYPGARLVDVVASSTPGGSLLDAQNDVGFYSDGFGRLPWSWEPAGKLRFELWQME